MSINLSVLLTLKNNTVSVRFKRIIHTKVVLRLKIYLLNNNHSIKLMG